MRANSVAGGVGASGATFVGVSGAGDAGDSHTIAFDDGGVDVANGVGTSGVSGHSACSS